MRARLRDLCAVKAQGAVRRFPARFRNRFRKRPFGLRGMVLYTYDRTNVKRYWAML